MKVWIFLLNVAHRCLVPQKACSCPLGSIRWGGNAVWVLGPNISRHYYAHLESYGQFSQGDWIKAGDVIGYVGNSGNARTTPPHLHYGIYRNGEGAINPYPYLIGD